MHAFKFARSESIWLQHVGNTAREGVHITDASSLTVFQRQLKTHFRLSYIEHYYMYTVNHKQEAPLPRRAQRVRRA